MATNHDINDVDSFCRLLIASGLLGTDRIDTVLADFRAKVDGSEKLGQSFTAFSTYLVTNGVLTCWQYAKLRNGQYKGFFLDAYKIMDFVGYDDTCSRFLCEDTSSQKYVVVCVKPPTTSTLTNGKCDYWVEEFVS